MRKEERIGVCVGNANWPGGSHGNWRVRTLLLLSHFNLTAFQHLIPNGIMNSYFLELCKKY